MTMLRNSQSIAWQAALKQAQTEAAEAARLAACARAFRVMFFRAWAQGYLSRPLYPLLDAQSVVEKPVPEEEEPVVIDAAARFLVQHPAALERELAATATHHPWDRQKPDHELRRLCRALVKDPNHFDRMLAQADEYHRERAEALRRAPSFRTEAEPVSSRPPADRVKPPQSIRTVIAEMDPLPTRLFRTRTRDDDIEEAPELPFVKWTTERLYYRETSDGQMERCWERATVQKMLAIGTLQIRGPRPDWARPLERHEREALKEERQAA